MLLLSDWERLLSSVAWLRSRFLRQNRLSWQELRDTFWLLARSGMEHGGSLGPSYNSNRIWNIYLKLEEHVLLFWRDYYQRCSEAVSSCSSCLYRLWYLNLCLVQCWVQMNSCVSLNGCHVISLIPAYDNQADSECAVFILTLFTLIKMWKRNIKPLQASCSSVLQ